MDVTAVRDELCKGEDHEWKVVQNKYDAKILILGYENQLGYFTSVRCLFIICRMLLT